MTAPKVLIDTNVLVALVDAKDKWHARAVELLGALQAGSVQIVYFDCVVNEAIGVIGRRAEEQKRSEQFDHLLDQIIEIVPFETITWISAVSERWFDSVFRLCREHSGRLNYNDAFMALVCRELGIHLILSFDGDFDEVAWLTRIADPAAALNIR